MKIYTIKYLLITLIILVFYSHINAQSLSAYQDYRNYFFVFDDGQTLQQEFLPIESFKVGGNSVAYVDNTKGFKIYYKSKTYPIDEGIISDYQATDNLVGFAAGKRLGVFDNGKTTVLSNLAYTYQMITITSHKTKSKEYHKVSRNSYNFTKRKICREKQNKLI